MRLFLAELNFLFARAFWHYDGCTEYFSVWLYNLLWTGNLSNWDETKLGIKTLCLASYLLCTLFHLSKPQLFCFVF